MSKSYGNTISLSDTPDDVLKKIRGMVTDPARIRKDDPGHPEVCSVYAFHKVFSEDKVDDICAQCKKGEIGCVACKKMLSERVAEFQTPIYEKRLEILSHEDTLIDIIKEGSAKAAVRAEKTMEDVRSAIKIGF